MNEHVELALRYLNLALGELEPVLDDRGYDSPTLRRKALIGTRNAIENAQTVLKRTESN